jgi:general nucleoside transport system permease protein
MMDALSFLFANFFTVNTQLIVLAALTPFLLAALGELVTERSGVLNLGVEGMMIMGAVAGFGGAFITQNPWVGIVTSILAGMAMALLFAVLAVTLVTNQVATGLALTLLGLGLSGLIGENFVGQPGVKLPAFNGIDPLMIAALALTVLVAYVLFRTKWGLVIRAVGNNHAAAHARATASPACDTFASSLVGPVLVWRAAISPLSIRPNGLRT